MWLLTTIGFFSIVEKPGDREAGRLTIRARVRGDLERLRAEVLPGLGPIEEGGGTDYAFRAVAPRAEVAAAMATLATTLDYANFKDAVAARQGVGREAVYGRVWKVLRDLGEEGGSPARGCRAFAQARDARADIGQAACLWRRAGRRRGSDPAAPAQGRL
jgi:hypothetical protein